MSGSDTESDNGNSVGSSTLTTTGAPARLCYVDDSRTSAYVVKRMLRPFGYVVDHFESAEPALIALVQDNYDLLLTDLKVSPKGMDGDDLVRALRKSGDNKISSMPVIVITGSTDTGVLANVYEAGANQIMTKPVNGDELNEHIRKLVYSSNNDYVDNKGSVSREPIDSAAKQAARIQAITLKKPIHSAKVLPFGADNKQNKTNDIEAALADLDSIPVLSPATNANLLAGNKSPQHRRATDGQSTDESNNVSVEVEVPRRVLASTPSKINSPATRDNFNDGMPRPAQIIPPAARVKPTIKVKQGDVDPNLKQKAANAVARQEAAKKAKAAVLIAQKKQALKIAQARKRKVEELKKNAEAAETLNKLKAAALKKVQLAKKQKALQAAQMAAALAAKKKKAAQIETDHLSLEPIDNIPSQSFTTPNVQQPTPPAVPVQKTAPVNTAASSDGSRPMQLKHPLDGGDFSGQQQPQAPKSPNANHSAPPPAVSNYGGGNILREMDQFPLVEADISDSYGSSRMLGAVTSILELYGAKKVIVMAVAITVLFFTYGTWSSLFDDGIPVDVSIVEQGEIFQSITVPGKVVSKLKVDLTPAIAGRLIEVHVDEGDSIKKGNLLARLDDREALSFLKRVNASLDSAKEDVVLAKRTLDRMNQAFKKGAIARQLVEDSEVELRSAKARESIANEEVRTAKLNLENPRIVAPFSGVITARYVEVGQWVVPSETLFTLIDPRQREIEVRVDAADSGGIAVGQTVGLSSDAFPGLEWSESVSRLAAATTNVGNSNTVSVYISLGANAPALRFGQQVDADIRTAWNPNAVKVPFGAIINREGRSWVAIYEAGKVRLVEVVTGIEDFSHVEILQGVGVGETIILANGKRLRDGEKVVLASSK